MPWVKAGTGLEWLEKATTKAVETWDPIWVMLIVFGVTLIGKSPEIIIALTSRWKVKTEVKQRLEQADKRFRQSMSARRKKLEPRQPKRR